MATGSAQQYLALNNEGVLQREALVLQHLGQVRLIALGPVVVGIKAAREATS